MMLRQLKRLHSEEQGMALIVSLMVAFVILMLSSVIVAQSLHSLNASGYDRQRLTSYNAAEAGVNAWWEDLQTTALASLSCSTKAAVMNTAPNEAQYSAAATFYAADGTTTMTCPFTSANPPSYVRILSTGSSEGEAAREVEAFGKLTPVVHGFRRRHHGGERHHVQQQLHRLREQRQQRRHLHPEREPEHLELADGLRQRLRAERGQPR